MMGKSRHMKEVANNLPSVYLPSGRRQRVRISTPFARRRRMVNEGSHDHRQRGYRRRSVLFLHLQVVSFYPLYGLPPRQVD